MIRYHRSLSVCVRCGTNKNQPRFSPDRPRQRTAVSRDGLYIHVCMHHSTCAFPVSGPAKNDVWHYYAPVNRYYYTYTKKYSTAPLQILSEAHNLILFTRPHHETQAIFLANTTVYIAYRSSTTTTCQRAQFLSYAELRVIKKKWGWLEKFWWTILFLFFVRGGLGTKILERRILKPKTQRFWFLFRIEKGVLRHGVYVNRLVASLVQNTGCNDRSPLYLWYQGQYLTLA